MKSREQLPPETILWIHLAGLATVLVTKNTDFAATKPYDLEKIPQDFTIVGVQVNQLPLLADIKTHE